MLNCVTLVSWKKCVFFTKCAKERGVDGVRRGLPQHEREREEEKEEEEKGANEMTRIVTHRCKWRQRKVTRIPFMEIFEFQFAFNLNQIIFQLVKEYKRKR